MTHVDIGTSKETRRRREQPTNPSELLISLHKRHKTETKEELQARFRDRIREDDAFLDQVIDFWFALNYKRLIEPAAEQPKPKPTAAEKAAAVESAKEAIKARVAVVMLDWEFNGKKLRDMTGRECAEAGGWLTAIAGKVKPDQKVGDALSAKQVEKLWKGERK